VDILLCNPSNRIQSPFAGIETPLWAGMMATHYREQGKEVGILDAEALDLSITETVAQIRDINPKKLIIVVMGNNPSVSSTPKMRPTKAIIDRLIGEMPIAVAGLHPSALPKETEHALGVDVIRAKIFDGVPRAAYDLMPMDRYIAHMWQCLDGSQRKPYASMATSLNCPNACNFCNVHALYGWQHRVWYKDDSEVIDDLDILVNKYGVRNIKFWDEHFTTNRERTIKLCWLIRDRKYNLNIWAYARVDSVDEFLLCAMREAGIQWIGYGFESGSDLMLAGVSKKATVTKARHAVEITHNAGININGNFMFNLPCDTQQTMQATLDFAKSLNLEFVNFYEAMAYPGSMIYNTQPKKNWDEFDQFSPIRLNTETGAFRDKAFNEFFTDINYQNYIRQKFGQQAVDQIESMLIMGKPKTRYADGYTRDCQEVI
jgi:anaerobic magnesium-protoporphyrin IX monomethyl ester cyclase